MTPIASLFVYVVDDFFLSETLEVNPVKDTCLTENLPIPLMDFSVFNATDYCGCIVKTNDL